MQTGTTLMKHFDWHVDRTKTISSQALRRVVVVDIAAPSGGALSILTDLEHVARAYVSEAIGECYGSPNGSADRTGSQCARCANKSSAASIWNESDESLLKGGPE